MKNFGFFFLGMSVAYFTIGIWTHFSDSSACAAVGCGLSFVCALCLIGMSYYD
jgi:hypothetical protein